MAASNTFYLKIISANRVFYSGRCRSLIVPEYDGQKEILAHHEDMVIAIDDGEMRFQPEGSENWEYAVVGMGFVEIVNNRVTLLVETAERPETTILTTGPLVIKSQRPPKKGLSAR